MKICHLTSGHNYNDIRISIKECLTLVHAKYDVHLIAPNTEVGNFKGIKVHGVKNPQLSRMKRFKELPKEIYLKSLELDADIYHFHDPELLPIGVKLKKQGKKVIYDVHEDLPRAILSKEWIPKLLRRIASLLFEWYENKSSKKLDYIVGATPHITKRFKGINSNININNYPLLDELSKKNKNNEKKNQVCFVGGITPIRGVKNIIEASNYIQGDIIMAGPISPTSLESEINNSKVKYKGIINREEVNYLLNESIAGLVLFLPEPNHINSQPNKMFEYMSAGICVIGSNFPLWRDIIEGNNCGICVDPLNVEEISAAIQWVLENPEEAAEMGRNGRKAVENKYNWEAESKKLIKMYEKLS